MSNRFQTFITYATALSTAVVAVGAFSFAPSTHSNANINAYSMIQQSQRRRNINTPSFIPSSSSSSNVQRSSSLFASAAAYPEGPNEWDDQRSSSSSSSKSSSSSSSARSSENIHNDDNIDTTSRTSPEFTTNFLPLESHPPSPQRLSRIEQEAKNKSKFLHGDELIELRKYITNLETDLKDAKDKNDSGRMRDLTRALFESQNLDAEYVYANCMEMAEMSESDDERTEWVKEANEAKDCLPQFNLQGLWVGKYGDHGYEMINVTYVGDTLIATKVTGDKNVPKGEITFTASLHPEAKGREELEPIELSDIATKQWGHKHLPRFPGQGHVAAEGFVDQQWMDGQLILVGDYFSFAWIPIGHQIFFGRPSAELTLKMLKQSKMADFGAVDAGSPNIVAEMRAHIEKCFEETELMIDDDTVVDDGELCFLMDDDEYFCQEGVFE